MDESISIDDFRYTYVDPRYFDNALVRSAFGMWYKTWTDSYRFFGWDPNQVRSDQWTRQDKVGILSFGEEPVGTLFFKKHDLDSPFIDKDSYFRMWREKDFEKLREKCPTSIVFVCSWFTLEASWRKKKRGIDAKGILGAICARSFLDSRFDVMVGTVVKQSNIHNLVYGVGARCLSEDVMEKNLATDLIYWSRHEYESIPLVEEAQKIKESELIVKPNLTEAA